MTRMFDNVLVTGGGGYVGNVLVPVLLQAGYGVHVFDVQFFGKNTLPLDHPRLKVTIATSDEFTAAPWL